MPVGPPNRRAFVAALGGAIAWPIVARAREMPRIAVLLNFTEKTGQPLLAVLLDELRRLGWVDGETAHIDVRWGAGDAQRIRKGIAELLALAPNVYSPRPNPRARRHPQTARGLLGSPFRSGRRSNVLRARPRRPISARRKLR